MIGPTSSSSCALEDSFEPLRGNHLQEACCPMTREAGLCCGLSTAMASRLAPGRHDASCTLVVKLNSATRLSLLAGQPKPMRASLLTQGLRHGRQAAAGQGNPLQLYRPRAVRRVV